MNICKIKRCDGKCHGNGYCSKHYQRFRKHGKVAQYTIFTPNQIILHKQYAEIVLRNVKQEIVGKSKIDLEDVEKCKEYKWRLDKHGYVVTTKIKLHRFLMSPPNDKVIDHIFRKPLDNRKKNLRICSQSLNTFNSKIRKDNTSGVAGVHWFKRKNKWTARISFNNKIINLGSFENREDAIKVRREAEEKYYQINRG